jgi:hypothetical protein
MKFCRQRLKLEGEVKMSVINGVRRRLDMEKDLRFKIMYGIKSFNSDGSEQPYDTSESAIYESLNEAIENQHYLFDSMCEEMKQHHPQRRKREQAFCYIQAVANVSEDNPNGEPVYPGCDDESISSEMIRKLDATYMTMKGE